MSLGLRHHMQFLMTNQYSRWTLFALLTLVILIAS